MRTWPPQRIVALWCLKPIAMECSVLVTEYAFHDPHWELGAALLAIADVLDRRCPAHGDELGQDLLIELQIDRHLVPEGEVQ